MAGSFTSRCLAVALAVACSALAIPQSASAASFTPTTTADGDNGTCTPALCTLRDAFEAAMADADPATTILVPPGTYVLTMGELDASGGLTVSGSGTRGTVIDAGGNSRVIEASTPDAVTFQDLTITGGSVGAADGGGILNQAGGGVTLRRIALTGNRSSAQGGGLAAPLESGFGAQTTIESSLIAGNTVSGGAGNGQGGGLALFGPATITNSTITGNTVSNPGTNQGGGILAAKDLVNANPVPLTLINSTIAGNSIQGVGMGGVTPNVGGGIAGTSILATPILSELRATNTIVAANTVDGSVQNCGLSTATETANNLTSDNTCGFTDGGSKRNTDPALGELADNGGPTNTFAITDTSPAFNAGTSTVCPSTDQRGTARPQNFLCDIGAYERVFETDLALTLTSPAKVKGGKTATFTATIANRGVVRETAPKLTVQISKPGITRAPRSCSIPPTKKKKKKGKKKGKRSKVGARTATCTLAAIPAGLTGVVSFPIKTGRKPMVINASAAVTGAVPSTNAANDAASASTRVKKAKKKKRR